MKSIKYIYTSKFIHYYIIPILGKVIYTKVFKSKTKNYYDGNIKRKAD